MANTHRLINNKGYEVDAFMVAAGTVDYDVRANEDNFQAGLSYEVEIAVDATVTVKCVYLDKNTGLEVIQEGIVIPEIRSPHAFPSGPIVNLLISASADANVQVINSVHDDL